MRLSCNELSDDQKKELAIFSNWILAIGDGTQQDVLFPDDYDVSMIKIPQDLLLEIGSDPILAIVSAVYPSIRDINVEFIN
jgi:ATP-dependent DNA helicase PIF1